MDGSRAKVGKLALERNVNISKYKVGCKYICHGSEEVHSSKTFLCVEGDKFFCVKQRRGTRGNRIYTCPRNSKEKLVWNSTVGLAELEKYELGGINLYSHVTSSGGAQKLGKRNLENGGLS